MPPTNAPTLDEFMTAARVTNPGVPDRDLRKYWAQTYSGIDPTTLPTYQTFLPKAQERNPDIPESALRQYWDEHYGDFGAAETDPKPSSLLRRSTDIPVGMAKGIVDLPRAAVGLADIPTSGGAGRIADAILSNLGSAADTVGLPSWARPSQWSEQLRSLYSPETQKALTSVGESAKTSEQQARDEGAGAFGQIGASMAGAVKGIAQNPDAAIPLLAENYGGMKLIALGTAKALRPLATSLDEAVKAGTMTAAEADATLGRAATRYAAAGEGILTAGQVSSGISSQDPEADFVHRLTASVAGATTAGITRGVSKIPGLGDAEASMATSALGRSTGATGSLPARIGKGAVSEGVLQEFPQSAQEQAWQNIGASQPWQTGVGEQAVEGLLAGSGMGGGIAAITGLTRQPEPPGAENRKAITQQGPSITAVPESIGLGNAEVGIDAAVQASWDLLESDRVAQEHNAAASQQQAEQQLLQGPSRDVSIPRVGSSIPILEGPEPVAPKASPIESPSALWMDEAVTVDPTIERGAAFTPRAERSPEARERIQAERERLLAMRRPAGDTPAEPVTTPQAEPDAEPVPLQSAVDLAYPPSERGRMPTQQELVARGRMPQKRAAEVPTMIEAPKTSPAQSPVVPASPFTPRQERELTPRERIAQERERLLAMRNRSMPSQPASAPPVEPGPSSPPPQGRPTPQPARLTAKAKKLTKREFLGTLSRAERKVIQATGFTPEDFWRNHATGKPIDAGKVDAQPHEVPRSTLPPEENAVMLLHAEKAKADMEIAGEERGGRYFMETQGQGGTMDVRGLKSPTADWYKDITKGPGKLSRKQIETAIQKIIQDHGVDVGTAVERVKQALLQDHEFRKTPWGEDAESIMQGEWPSWIPKPDEAQAEPAQQEGEPFSLTSQEVRQPNAKVEDRQTSLEVPPETIGSRPIIGRETTPEESPLFSKTAQEADEEQTALPESASLNLNPEPEPKPEPTDDIALDDIPDGLIVDVTAIRQATGDEMTVKEDAKEALERIDASIAKYTKLLECLGA